MVNVSPKRKPTNFRLVQGSDFFFYHRLVDDTTQLPIDITNYTFEMQIRTEYSDASPLITLSETNGRITHTDDLDGTILCHITAIDTAALPVDTSSSFTSPPSEDWVYDLEADAHVFPPGKYKTLFGKITAVAEVTK